MSSLAHRISVNLDLHVAPGAFPFQVSGDLLVDGHKVEHVSSLEMRMSEAGEHLLVIRFAEGMTPEEARKAPPAMRDAIVYAIRGLRCFPFVRIESPFLNA
jgi:hypothetical protein